MLLSGEVGFGRQFIYRSTQPAVFELFLFTYIYYLFTFKLYQEVRHIVHMLSKHYNRNTYKHIRPDTIGSFTQKQKSKASETNGYSVRTENLSKEYIKPKGAERRVRFLFLLQENKK